MAIQDAFFVRVGFEDALITVLRNAVDRCVSKKDELFDCGIKLDIALKHRSAGDSADVEDGWVVLSTELKGVVGRLKSMFPDYGFKVRAGIQNSNHRLTCIMVQGMTNRYMATEIRDRILEQPGFGWLKEIIHGH